MKQELFNRVRSFLTIVSILTMFSMSSQIVVKAPEPAPNPTGSTWTAICAGVGGFNSYYAKVSWAGTANSDNAFILELSDNTGNFDNAVKLDSIVDQNTNNPKEFNVEFAIPTDTRGTGYKLRVRSTSPKDDEESADAYDMYYMDVTSNINISELGDRNPPGTLCSANPITLQVDNIDNPETYQYIWYRSGTQLTSEIGHTISVTQSGMYQAFIDYGNICTGSGNTDSNIVDVTIGSSGSGIAITPPSKTALCAGDVETLTIDATDPSWNYQWYKDSAAISGASASTYDVDASIGGFEGDYQVEISGSGICTDRSASVTITNADNFTVTRGNDENVVVLPSITETISVTTNAVSPTYQWYRNGSVITGETNSSLDITQDGTYYAEVTQSGGTCPGTVKNSETTTAVIPASLEVIIDYNTPHTACVDTSTIIEVATINSVDAGGNKTDVTSQLQTSFAYQWQLNGVNVAGETSQSISITDINNNGDYTLEAVLSSYNATSNELPVQLLTSETVGITSSSTIYCSSSDIITIDTTTDLSSETYRWEQDGNSINTTDASITVTTPGTYRLVLDKNGCDLSSNEVTISPLDPDLITLDVDGDVIFPENSSKTVRASGGTSYQWFDSNNILMSSTDSMTFTEEGEFILIANIDNCEVSRTLNAVYLELFNVPNVVTPNGDGANDLWIIPNSYSNKQDVRIIIYDSKGVELFNQTSYQNNWPSSSTTFSSQNSVYYYVIKNTSEVLKQGTITVIR